MRVGLLGVVLWGTGVGCAKDPDTPTDQATDSGETAVDTEDTAPDYTIWSGAALVFEKPDYGDPTDPANQDAISEKVVLTRGNGDSLFNVVEESSARPGSPQGTEWAEGTTAEIASLKFASLKSAAGGQMKSVPNTAFVLHLIEDDVYIDVTFLGWTSGKGAGGGFSYERSTPN